MGDFDSSDDDSIAFDSNPFVINWLSECNTSSQIPCLPYVGLSALPGCRFKDICRRLETDIETLLQVKVADVFVLCTKGELRKFRVPNLLESYTKAGIQVHHYPFEDGGIPDISNLNDMMMEIVKCSKAERKCLIHCYGGLGRTGVVAVCFMLQMDPSLSPDAAIEKLRKLRGPRAIQTVKQYNFINEFRGLLNSEDMRCVSR